MTDLELAPERWNVSYLLAVKAMALNALGFTSRVLCLTGEFFKTKPIDFIRKAFSPGELNGDAVGLTLRCKANEVGLYLFASRPVLILFPLTPLLPSS